MVQVAAEVVLLERKILLVRYRTDGKNGLSRTAEFISSITRTEQRNGKIQERKDRYV